VNAMRESLICFLAMVPNAFVVGVILDLYCLFYIEMASSLGVHAFEIIVAKVVMMISCPIALAFFC